MASFIAHLFNGALVKGFPPSWTLHSIAPIHKASDPMDPGNHKTMMVSHRLAKLYGLFIEQEINGLEERFGFKALG